MLRDDAGTDSTTPLPVGDDLHPNRRHGGGEVVSDLIGHSFVEDAFVSKRLEIHLETLQFDADRGRFIAHGDRSEVRMTGLGTDRGELLVDMFDDERGLGGGIEEFKQLAVGHQSVITVSKWPGSR